MVSFTGNYSETEHSRYTEITVPSDETLVVRITEEGETLENYLFDIENDGADVTILTYPDEDDLLDNFTLRNIGIRGESPQDGDYLLIIACHDEGVIDTVYMADGCTTYPVSSNWEAHPGGIWAPAQHDGHINIREVYSANWVDNGMYLSPSNGRFTIERCFVVDCQISCFSVSHQDDIIRNCYGRARQHDHRVLWSRNNGVPFVGNCEFDGLLVFDNDAVVENTSYGSITGQWTDAGGNDQNPEMYVPTGVPSDSISAATGESEDSEPIRDNYENMLYVDVQDYDDYVEYEFSTSGELVEGSYGDTRVDTSTSVSRDEANYIGTGESQNYDDSWFFNGELNSLESTPKNTGADFRLNGSIIYPGNWDRDFEYTFETPYSLAQGQIANFKIEIQNKTSADEVLQVGLNIGETEFRKDLTVNGNDTNSHTFSVGNLDVDDYDWRLFGPQDERTGELTVYVPDDIPSDPDALGFIRVDLGRGPENIPFYPLDMVEYPCIRVASNGEVGAFRIAPRGNADFPELSLETAGGIYGINGQDDRKPSGFNYTYFEDFDHNDLGGYFTLDNDHFSLTTDWSYESDRSVRLRTNSFVAGEILSTDLHETSPEAGDEFQFIIYTNSGTEETERRAEHIFRFGHNGSEFFGVKLEIDTGDVVITERNQDVDTSNLIREVTRNSGFTIPANKPIIGYVKWHEDNTIDVKYIDPETMGSITSWTTGTPEHHNRTDGRFSIRHVAFENDHEIYTDGLRYV